MRVCRGGGEEGEGCGGDEVVELCADELFCCNRSKSAGLRFVLRGRENTPREGEMFSSCSPWSAFVEGVKSGSTSFEDSS